MRFSPVICWCSNSEALQFPEHIHFILVPPYYPLLGRRLVYTPPLTVHNNLQSKKQQKKDNNQLLEQRCA